jgi:hypothetical protein
MGHAGERVFDWAWEFSPVGATLGGVLGGWRGWPHQYNHPLASNPYLIEHEYRNSFITGEFGHVVETCIVAIGLAAALGAVIVAMVVGVFKSANPPPRK